MKATVARRAALALIAGVIAGCSASQAEPVAVDAPSVTTVLERVDETASSSPVEEASTTTTTIAPATPESDASSGDTESADDVVEATYSAAVASVMSNN